MGYRSASRVFILPTADPRRDAKSSDTLQRDRKHRDVRRRGDLPKQEGKSQSLSCRLFYSTRCTRVTGPAWLVGAGGHRTPRAEKRLFGAARKTLIATNGDLA